MNMDDYPHFALAEDGRLCSMGQHCSGFLQVLYNAVLHLGYNGVVPIYCCRLSMVDDLDMCDTNMMIPLNPLNPLEPWTRTVVSSKPDTTIEQMAHVALTSQCESRLATTTTMPIALFLIRNQENPMWKRCLETVSNLEGLHFNTGTAAMAKYAKYLFNLQQNTTRTVMQQGMHLTSYDEHNTTISRELEQQKQENALLHSGTFPFRQGP
jgi:hypothetical protein